MQTWKWLYNPETPYTWQFVRNVVLKTAILFVLFNLAFAGLRPLPLLGRASIYNWLVPGRERLPYGENPPASYNLSLYSIEAMFASHTLVAKREPDEFRVLLVGDSSVWGILLKPDDTLAGQINQAHYRTADGRTVRAYNIGYPTMSLTKDLVLLDYAMRYNPDLIVWLFTLESFGKRRQLDPSFLQNNADRVRNLIEKYNLDQNTQDPRFVDRDFWDETLIGQRRSLADLLRLQLYGIPWATTGIDQEYGDYTPRSVDLAADTTWQEYQEGTLTTNDLAFDVLRAGIERASDTPVLLINEPMFISDGQNSDLRYNFFYPRWAYDDYRAWLVETSTESGWHLLDLWDAIPEAACYTDSPVHLTPDCSARLSALVGPAIREMADTEALMGKPDSPPAGFAQSLKSIQ